MPKGAAKDTGGDADKDMLDGKDLRELIRAFDTFKRDYRSDMRELKDSVSFCTDICNDVKGIAENIKQLRQEMHGIVNENKALKAENERLAQKCEELEQYQRLNNVEIKGVPAEDDPVLTIQKIGKSVGEAVEAADLDTCHWVRSSKQNAQSIIARFVRRSKRNAFLSKCRKQKIDSSVLGSEAKTPIYVNENLTQANKALLSAAIQKKKAANWKFVWTNSGKILARKDEGSSVVRIATQADLIQICADTALNA